VGFTIKISSSATKCNAYQMPCNQMLVTTIEWTCGKL